MKVFKFGGASVKDANGVKNLVHVLKIMGIDNTLVVISAMGKTTNAFEVVVKNYFQNKKELQSSLQEVKKFHNAILFDLFETERHAVFKKVDRLFKEVSDFFDRNKSSDYNFVYAQVVSYVALRSTAIVGYYLIDTGITISVIDARECIKTDTDYRDAKVNWELTQQ